MTLREELRKLAEKSYQDCCDFERSSIEIIESAILAGIRLVLERKPSQEMLIAGSLHSSAPIRYRAMTAQLLKELDT